MKRVLLAAVLLLLFGCAEEVQVHRAIGVVKTESSRATVAEIPFTDSGRWTIFQLIDNTGSLQWPLPFRAEVIDARGVSVIARYITAKDATARRTTKGAQILTWRVDSLKAELEANIDTEGNFPIDRVLKDGDRYILRLSLPAGQPASFHVVLLENRWLYPWQYD